MEIDRNAILASFKVESEEALDNMEQSLLALESNPGDQERAMVIFRAVHTLKGSAFSLELNAVGGFAHQLEDILDRVVAGSLPVTGALCSLLLRSVDALRRAVASAVRGKDRIPANDAGLMREILAFAGRRGDSPEGRNTDNSTNPTAASTAHSDTRPTLRVGIEKLDRMLDLTGEIAIAQGRLESLLEQLGGAGREAMETHASVKRLIGALQEEVMKVRMVPIHPLFQQFYRVVRDTAQFHGKMARLVTEGGDVEVDTAIVEHLKDPLMHMIRNAIDHGLEPPKVRRRQGKPAQGVIRLRAAHESGSIVVQVVDDGAGFNRERMLARAAASGNPLDPKRATDQEVFALAFQSGFSTAEAVTELSGRGVGMEVVKRNIERLRGTVRIDSAPGKGSVITIRLPLTLAIISGFSVRVGEDTFVLPLESVVECVEMPLDQIAGHNGGVINLRGEALPYVRLREIFEVPGSAPERENIVVIEHAGGRAGLAADALVGEHQAVIKPMGRLFDRVNGIAGSTILGTGEVALILDVPSLCNEMIERQRAFDASAGNGAHAGANEATV